MSDADTFDAIPNATCKLVRRVTRRRRSVETSKTGTEDVSMTLTGIIEREGDGYVSLCPGVDVASQGNTIEEARRNLAEAVELYFETASPQEIQERLRSEVYVTRLEVKVG